jgi:hypothetical protein
VVRIGNTKAICTSSYLYDSSILFTHTGFAFETYDVLQSLQAQSPYSSYAKDCSKAFDMWFVKMLKTAAGDAFSEEFQAYYLGRNVNPYENEIFARAYKNAALVHYKVLQFYRGLDASNVILKVGHETVQELLKRELTEDEKLDADGEVDEIDALLSDPEVLVKFKELPQKLQCTMNAAIIEYVFDREIGVKFSSFYMTLPQLYDTLVVRTEPEPDYPQIIRDIPFDSGMVVLCPKQEPPIIRVDTFYEALVAWASVVTKHYDGEIYDANNNRVTLKRFFKTIF